MSIAAVLDAEVDAGDDEESDTSENFGFIDKESGVEDDISSFARADICWLASSSCALGLQ